MRVRLRLRKTYMLSVLSSLKYFSGALFICVYMCQLLLIYTFIFQLHVCEISKIIPIYS